MRALAFDPGAKRMGFAVVEGDGKSAPKEVAGGHFGLERGEATYQEHRLALVSLWAKATPRMLRSYDPDVVVCEIVPSRGFNDASQSLLAMSAISAVQALAFFQGYPVEQIGATSVKAKIGLKKDDQKTATKVGVRNGVYKLLPSTERFRQEWVSVHDVSDAFGIALCHLGYTNKGKNGVSKR